MLEMLFLSCPVLSFFMALKILQYHHMQGLTPSQVKTPISFLLYMNIFLNIWVFCSITFVETLKKLGVPADLILYKGKTHTDLFVQVSFHSCPIEIGTLCS